MSTGLVSSEASFSDSRMVIFSLCPHVFIPLCARLCPNLLYLDGHCRIGFEPTQMTAFHLNPFLKTLYANAVTFCVPESLGP